MSRGAWLACVALCACVASESGNPVPRCNQTSDCGAELSELFCYRGFCVRDEEELEPDFTPDDAGALAVYDAAAPVVVPAADASAPLPVPSVVDTGSTVAVNDAAVEPAPLRCLNECRAPAQDTSPCKKCVKSAFGDEPDKLCGKADDEDDDKKLTGPRNPICVALCLGAANRDPICGGPLLLCKGSKCGGLP